MDLKEPAITMDPRTRVLQKQLLSISFFNLLLVAISGLWLRSYPFFDFALLFKNVLHGHSHFAFGGWLMPMLLSLILRYIPFLSQKITYPHWRNVSIMLLVSAYGMLFSFPFGGYYLVSIIFSTTSVLASFYLAYLVCKACKNQPSTAIVFFLQWAMFYGILSSAGPFLTAPLIAFGYQGSPAYYNAIYFYLHFQYNGLFTFLVLAVFYSRFLSGAKATNAIRVFFLLNCAVLPTFALSILWTQPSVWYNIIGGWGSILQLGAFFFLLKDFGQAVQFKKGNFLLSFLMGALGIKFLLQFLSAFPAIALLATEQRNFIIAYLHLVLLGFISMLVFAVVWPAIKFSIRRKAGLTIFLAGFFLTESLLVIQSVLAQYSMPFPGFFTWMFICSLLLPLGIFCFSFQTSFIQNFREQLKIKKSRGRKKEWAITIVR